VEQVQEDHGQSNADAADGVEEEETAEKRIANDE
jgi:hypothetical protein